MNNELQFNPSHDQFHPTASMVTQTPAPDGVRFPPGVYRFVNAEEMSELSRFGFAKSLAEPLHDVHTDRLGLQWHRFGIDTGCCFGGRLTALVMARGSVLPQMEFVSVAAHGVYAQQWLGDSA